MGGCAPFGNPYPFLREQNVVSTSTRKTYSQLDVSNQAIKAPATVGTHSYKLVECIVDRSGGRGDRVASRYSRDTQLMKALSYKTLGALH